jgi:hypothetical protein
MRECFLNIKGGGPMATKFSNFLKSSCKGPQNWTEIPNFLCTWFQFDRFRVDITAIHETFL